MKKFKFTFLILLLCSVLIFAGCTKADSANAGAISALYNSYIEKYGAENEQKTKIFNQNGQPDLYSEKAYNADLYAEITKLVDGNASSPVNMLAEYQEYDAILKAVSNLYFYKTFSVTLDADQSLLTKMYQKMEDLKSTLDDVLTKKRAIETRFQSMETFGKAYAELIQKIYAINDVYDRIYTKHIYVPEEVIAVPAGETSRVVLSSEIYLGEYYYQKHFVLNSDFTNLFGHEKVFNAETGEAETNNSYDALFAEFQEIVKNTANVGDPSNPANYDAVTYYNACITKLAGLNAGVKNYASAVKKINEYLQKHNIKNMSDIDANTSVYQYVEFVKNFDIEIQSYQSYLINNIIFKTY